MKSLITQSFINQNIMSGSDSRDIINFGLETTFKCYCGKKIKILYDETTGTRDTICKYCKYDHMDFVYTVRKHKELSTRDFLNSFYK